ncbi:MAG TPA: hypothetical protein PKD53_14925 [Chloroflexaceae bacterium]|nr:hypothetical protein [Chloroflexaceae bacterium]
MLRSLLAWMLLSLLATFPATSVHAELPESATPRAVGLAQLDGVLSQADGSLTLDQGAGPAPRVFGGHQRFGTLVSQPLTLDQPTTRLQLTYAALTPPGAEARVDVRGSADGQRWLPWLTDLPAGSVVSFGQPVRYAQYRVALAGGLGVAPAVREVRLATTSQAPTVSAAAAPSYAVAPTFRVRGTRMGMVGGRTANGWIIPPRARFASLPSWTVLSSRGGNEYQVRISYRGRSVVVPVYDVGPYSERDDYWDAQRDGYPELERGWPMDHAAFYEGYNGGRADKGHVRFPTAIDVGDGAWLDDLGIVGDQAELEVTFLWLGQDPAAGPPARDPAAPEHVADELGGDFWHSAPLAPSLVGCGAGRHAYWATGGGDPAAAPVGRWQPTLPAEALYDVFVHVPRCPHKRGPAEAARYVVQHRDGALEVAVNQAEQTGWVHLGRYPFAAGAGGFVQLGAIAPDGATVWFDQVKWVRVP